MQIRFWGVRGSLPSPMLPSQIKEKIAAILEQALPEDIASAESRRRFLDSLPSWLYGTVGGNSPCLTIAIDGFDEPVIFDCGSGMREYGLRCLDQDPMPRRYHVFFSHFHWDHLLGFPFFDPAYDPSVTLELYSPMSGLGDVLQGQMCSPYFPVPIEKLPAKRKCHHLQQPIALGPAELSFRKMSHPGDSYSYLLTSGGKRFIYATDTELSPSDFAQDEENVRFFKDADLLVLDSQYTIGEAIDKYNWGHSAFNLSVDFAVNWGVKHLVLFHHDPAYDDRKLAGMLQSARWYLERMNVKGLEVSLATEELEIAL
ncbi:MAG: MBL fold metallo-hydrolase [Treponema sp.]|nr:MBL fold metallo-hydrolase [Treponema sp.]